LLRIAAPVIVEGCYGDFWHFRKVKREQILKSKFWKLLYDKYLDDSCSFVGINAKIDGVPRCPHGLRGVFISQMSEIGSGCVIFQQVTIGSNAIKGHPRSGAPKIGNNVYIGAGATIIGNVTIGNNCRIGANCVVVKDMPANTTAVSASARFIQSNEPMDNTSQSPNDFVKTKHRND
jgi:serine acetyltransferase